MSSSLKVECSRPLGPRGIQYTDGLMAIVSRDRRVGLPRFLRSTSLLSPTDDGDFLESTILWQSDLSPTST